MEEEIFEDKYNQPNKRWQSGYVYVIDYGDTRTFKIGYTTQEPGNRLRQIMTTNVIMPMKFVFTSQVYSNAYYVENLLHMTYDSRHEAGEWFKLDIMDLVNIMRTLSLLGCEIEIDDHWYEICKAWNWEEFHKRDMFNVYTPHFTKQQEREHKAYIREPIDSLTEWVGGEFNDAPATS